MEQFLEHSFSWPTVPATVLLAFICGYWILMILGAVDLDFLDLDIDLDVDAEIDADVDLDVSSSVLQIGMVPLRFLNLGSVPTMLWLSIFALSGWLVSRLWGSPLPHQVFDWTIDPLAIVRNFGVAALITKAITQPMRGRFDPVEPNKAEDIVGRTCVVTTSEVTEDFGEGELATDGSPLKLRIRSDNAAIGKGDTVLITEHVHADNVYLVDKA